MAEKLKLRTTGSKKVRMHIVWFVIVVLALLAVGYFAGQYNIFKIYSPDKNCIPQKDMQFFIDEANKWQAEYKGCVKDAWDLYLSCKVKLPSEYTVDSNTTSVNSSN